ncbi:ATP-binding cassette long-chain fatty acid transporter pxa1 [Spiromyces aspiralis]|uniref:ATP-binding cassette long-chain fatty acid transporter pxa1 n=1 Tax=Spiromyces aspiralis TaxID=68401 RepID=A0ACC1HFN7_9FUNG|nr:ATP-binding cassette long-chain fatty acid transporter pxa1 [Spiromyces aspiralis]
MPTVLSKGTAIGAVSIFTLWYNYTIHKRVSKKLHDASKLHPSASRPNLSAWRSVAPDEQDRIFDRDAPPFLNPSNRGKPLRQLLAIMRILVPSWRSKEMFLIVLHTTFLIIRTWLSVIIAELDGKIVKHLVRGQGKKFLAGLVSWFAISVPATYTNSMIKYLENKLSIAFRTRLTRYVHDLYLSDNMTFHKLLLPGTSSCLSNPDQYIATDIARFCSALSSVFSSVGKPVLDMLTFHIQLIRGIGGYGTASMFLIYLATIKLLRKCSPPLGKLAESEANLEGELRSSHSRLITNSEEVAFYNGHTRESESLTRSLDKLITHASYVAKVKIPRVFLEDFAIKYTWSAVGYILCAIPFVMDPSINAGQRMQRFTTNKRLMTNLGDAGGRLMYSLKEMMELGGKTARVYDLVSMLHYLRKYDGRCPSSSVRVYEDYDGIRLTNVNVCTPESGGVKVAANSISSSGHSSSSNEFAAGSDSECDTVGNEDGSNSGDDSSSDGTTATSTMLVEGLNWHVKPNEHWLITGPNGAGKTAVMRVVSGLWSPAVVSATKRYSNGAVRQPLLSSSSSSSTSIMCTIEKPEASDIMYIPQRAYLPIGTLRDQVIYPHTHAEMRDNGVTDNDLMKILTKVHLSYLPRREGGWDVCKEWKDVFSGGEKQRMSLARVLYHQPRFAFLDECTSAVSADVEDDLYSQIKKAGITLITISHRPFALQKHHQKLLTLGCGDNEPTGLSGALRRYIAIDQKEGKK